MEQLQGKLSEKTYKEFESFLANHSDFTSSQKDKLMKLILRIFSEGETNGFHKSCNLNGKISAKDYEKYGPKSAL